MERNPGTGTKSGFSENQAHETRVWRNLGTGTKPGFGESLARKRNPGSGSGTNSGTKSQGGGG
jgi:hypothetical protein